MSWRRRCADPSVPNRQRRFETRVRAVVVALIAISALSANVGELKRILEAPPQPTADKISGYEERFGRLKTVLPRHGIVGFVTDARDYLETYKRRFLAGYVLAPVIVARDADWPLVIGDFKDPASMKPMTDGALRVLEDFGGGLVLLTPEEQ
jgi:hypothetical protein